MSLGGSGVSTGGVKILRAEKICQIRPGICIELKTGFVNKTPDFSSLKTLNQGKFQRPPKYEGPKDRSHTSLPFSNPLKYGNGMGPAYGKGVPLLKVFGEFPKKFHQKKCLRG